MNQYTKFLFLISSLLAVNSNIAHSQYAPQVPLVGHEGIHKSDERIVAWASGANISKGYIDIQVPSMGVASYGTDSNAVGIADGSVVSLGDSGVALLTFDVPIVNGNGPDFVVFENGFAHPTDSFLAYLELAFVEVSSDGERFVRFPAVSLTDTTEQQDNFSYLDARHIHNLAGKYINNYGTPFDLEDIKDSVGIDVNDIRYIRIVDVIGSIARSVGSYDHFGRVINEPYPSHFTSSGFDLDAVGVINTSNPSNIVNNSEPQPISIYPNPVENILHLHTSYLGNIFIYALNGSKILEIAGSENISVNVSQLSPGLYFLKQGNASIQFVKK